MAQRLPIYACSLYFIIFVNPNKKISFSLHQHLPCQVKANAKIINK